MLAEADVQPISETDVTVRRSLRIEDFRVPEGVFVIITRDIGEIKQVALLDLPAAQFIMILKKNLIGTYLRNYLECLNLICFFL